MPETRNFFAKTGVAIGLTLLGSAGILVAFVTIVGGSLLTQEAVRVLGVPAATWDTIALLRWPLMLVLVAFAVAILLRFAPNVAVPFRWPMVGGLVFAIGWVVATALFALYVANFANYSNTYGALGGVVVLMLWFYLTAVMLLLAAELTSLLAKDHAPERIAARQREIKVAEAGEAQSGIEAPAPGVAPAPIAARPEVVLVAPPRRARAGADDDAGGPARVRRRDRGRARRAGDPGRAGRGALTAAERDGVEAGPRGRCTRAAPRTRGCRSR